MVCFFVLTAIAPHDTVLAERVRPGEKRPHRSRRVTTAAATATAVLASSGWRLVKGVKEAVKVALGVLEEVPACDTRLLFRR
eukprot:COSAG06_NODE_792_length_12273_cov_19.284048_8_plen_82_part_00